GGRGEGQHRHVPGNAAQALQGRKLRQAGAGDLKAPDLPPIVAFLTELDRLKLVYRRSYARDLSRRENSAEHSWHLAMAVLTFASEMDLPIDVPRTVEMALAHDVCEIDADDVSVYERNAQERAVTELACVNRLAG